MSFDCLVHGHDWQERRCTKCGKIEYYDIKV